MKRLTLFLVIIHMLNMPLMAERVTPETAHKVAATFLNNNGAKSNHLTDLSKAAGFPNLYIFTTEESFVVMAADDCVQPILGYSLTGKFVAENTPTNVSGWLQGYNDQIQYAIDSKTTALPEITKLWKDMAEGNSKTAKATVVVTPLIQTKWNQGNYYNDLCPAVSDGPNYHAYTGCAATAMAQIMKYWEYPTHGVGSHSYTWHNQTISADFGSTTYDWDNMTNHYEYYYATGTGEATWIDAPTQAQLSAVATLMYHCGVSVEMNYGGRSTGGSSVSTDNVANALKTYFNYSPNIECKMKDDYEDAVWKDMVKVELDNGRPLEYCGQDPDPNGGGHAFVCDGYDSDSYFHFNWGWSGHYDGYFTLSNLDTGANSGESGAGNGVYSNQQGAIFGIQPVQCAASDPTNLTYTLNGLQEVTLTWTPANGAASYNIYRNNILVGSSSNCSYTETAPFGTNVYYVRSVDTNGVMSLSSNAITVTIGYLTPIVDDLDASCSEHNINLTWSAPEWCYPETPSSTLTYGTQSNSPGYFPFGTNLRYWGHRHLTENLSTYQGLRLYSVDFHANNVGAYELCIFEGTTTRDEYTVPVSQVYSQPISVTTSGWNTINLEEPYYINSNQDLWIFMHNTEAFDDLRVYLCSAEGNNGVYYSGNPSSYIYNNAPGYAFLIKAYLTDDTYTYNLYQDGVSIATNLSGTTYSNVSLNNNATNLFTVRTNYYGGETEASNMVGFTKGIASLSDLDLGTNDKMTITEGSKLTVSGTLINNNPSHLIIEDGAQLINDNEGVKATVKKTIQPYTEGLNNGWNLIASPITEQLDADDDVNGLVSGAYDLYIFDQNGSDGKEWRNYEAQTFTTIDNKVGYLYSNSNETTISFTGTLAGTVTPTTITRNDNVEFEGFNLIGNPYPCEVYTNQPYYTLQYNEEDDKTYFVLGESGSSIPPCTAILVQAQTSEESVTFSKTPLAKQASIAMRLTKSNTRSTHHIDQARISFEAGSQLSKYTWNDASSTIYIPQNGQNYAVAYANGANEIPINFKAVQNGTYTLGFETNNLELDYLHLIDDMTGDDVDILDTPHYTFEAKTSDFASRFRLVFSNSENAVDDDETFAYVSNGEIVICADACNASLQIVDMTGRVVISRCERIQCVPTTGMAQGVYVLRLINGNNVKTQKIIIE